MGLNWTVSNATLIGHPFHRAYYRYRDREQVLQIALEPNTPRLLHATIAVFYGAIHTVAKISNLPDRVADTQAFLDDLCRICLSDNTGEFRLGCFCLGAESADVVFRRTGRVHQAREPALRKDVLFPPRAGAFPRSLLPTKKSH